MHFIEDQSRGIFHPLSYTHAVRNRPWNSPQPLPVRSRPRSQACSSPAASSPPTIISIRSVAPTPSAAACAVLRTHFPSAAVRAAKVAHHQRLLLPNYLQPLPCTHAVRSRPRHSPHPFAVRCRPGSQARSSPVASSPHHSPPISSDSLAPTLSATVRALLRSAQPSSFITTLRTHFP